MKKIVFTKMQGLGNDYIYIDCVTNPCPDNVEELAREMSPRHTAVGSDGIILILPSDIADFRMRIFNADGSEGAMCGNGIRCVGKFVYDHGLTTKLTVTVETNSGIKKLQLSPDKKTEKISKVNVDMGKPSTICSEIPVVFSKEEMIDEPVATSHGEFRVTAVSMGNPHGVIFVKSVDSMDVREVGPELENHKMWPDRANIEFVEVVDRSHIRFRVWERGSGETMACGTGACAAVVAAMRNGLVDNRVKVSMRFGDLIIQIDEETGHVMMDGPAVEVYSGIYIRESERVTDVKPKNPTE